jgi:hypothetical protein
MDLAETWNGAITDDNSDSSAILDFAIVDDWIRRQSENGECGKQQVEEVATSHKTGGRLEFYSGAMCE